MAKSRRSPTMPAMVFLLVAVSLGLTSCRRKEVPSGDFVAAVKATSPLAYYRLETASGSSETGGSDYKFIDGTTVSDSGAPIAIATNKSALLDGKTGWVSTTQKGGITTAASIMAWVNLAATPKETRRILYVAGESEYGNDLDLQFEGDDEIRFYTAAGTNLHYAPDSQTLVRHWHMIVATFDTVAGTRALYWDGQQVAADKDPGKPNKNSPFSIGASTYFHGRFFPGNIDEVALWNRSLSASEVTSLYKAGK